MRRFEISYERRPCASLRESFGYNPALTPQQFLSPGRRGRCTLTRPDPQLKGAWYPRGFNPCACQVKNRFQNVPFEMQRAPLRPGFAERKLMLLHDAGRVGTFLQFVTGNMVRVTNLSPGSEQP
jgi:hypothetical protein